jgi:hypothetical protein
MILKAFSLATLTVLCASCGDHEHGPNCNHAAPKTAAHVHGKNCDHDHKEHAHDAHEHGENCDHDHKEHAHDAHEHGENCDHAETPKVDAAHEHGPDCDHAETPKVEAAHEHGPDCDHAAPQKELTKVSAHDCNYHVSMGTIGHFQISCDKPEAQTEIRGTIINSATDESLKCKATTVDGGKTYTLMITELPEDLTDAQVILEIGQGDQVVEKAIQLK